MNYLPKTFLILDESGAFHLKNDKYFIIGGYITKHLHKIRSIHKKTEQILNLHNDDELKACNLSPYYKSLFINNLLSDKDVKVVAIVVDKESLKKREIEENIIYNLLIKYMLEFLIKYHGYLFNNIITLYLDNRSIKIKYKNQLETYLYLELSEKYNKEFVVDYKDSKHYREIQMADYIANFLYGRYNYYTKEKTSSLVKNKEKFIIYKFPFNNFNFPH